MRFERRTTQFKAFTPSLSHADYSTLSDQAELRYEDTPFKRSKDDLFSLPISSKPSLVQLSSHLSSNTEVRMHHEDIKIPLKPPCTASPSNDSSEHLEENLVDVLFASMSSLAPYEKNDMVDIEDDEITEMWRNAHETKQPVKMEVYRKKLNQNTAKAGVASNASEFLFKKNPVKSVFIAKSA